MNKSHVVVLLVLLVGAGAGLWWTLRPSEVDPAREALEAGEPEQAVDLLRAVVKEDKDNANAQFLLGIAYYAKSMKAYDTDREAGDRALRQAVKALHDAVKVDDMTYRARLYEAIVRARTGDHERAARVVGVSPDGPDELEAFAAARAGFLFGLGKVIEAVEVEKAVEVEPGTWTPVLASPDFESTTMVILGPNTARCEATEPFPVNRGDAFEVSDWGDDGPSFTKMTEPDAEGWMSADAWKERPRWGTKRYVLSKYSAEPYVFEGELGECGGSQSVTFALQYQAKRAGVRRLWGRELETVQLAGRTTQTRWRTAVGACNYRLEWVRVRWKRPVTLSCSLESEQEVARGTGLLDIDRWRFKLIGMAAWPASIKRHLLRGELAKGITVAMAAAAVGELDAGAMVLGEKLLRTEWQALSINSVLTFEDGRLVSWEPPSLEFEFEGMDDGGGMEEEGEDM